MLNASPNPFLLNIMFKSRVKCRAQTLDDVRDVNYLATRLSLF